MGLKHSTAHIIVCHLCEISRTAKSVETESRSGVTRDCGDRGTGSDCSWIQNFLLG